MNGVQTRLKCKPNVKRCKRFVFAAHSPLLHPNTLKTKAIIHFQTDHILTRFVFPPLDGSYNRELTTDAAKAESIPYKTATPKVSGGFTNILNYKWIDLTFTLTYSLGGYSFDKLGTYIENGSSSIYSSRYNLPAYMMNRWQKPGDQTDTPRFVYGEPATSTNSSRYIHSTDHLRLKNFTLGFTLPNQWTQKLMIDKVRVYFSGNNLLTWAKWKQYDPETPVNGEVFCEAPAMRTFSFGAQLSF